ncbi:sulfatase-like hydrolase/transferase [Helicobacter sp. 11S02596-1]|uniref:sulfatase-like hydrolase/transferase n=1 Tax=Helicobacter sp. 11S02596-1 TaxID=1476194 RepID=UPI00117A5667|nr:sulfatase-like hydrolase/transferase [Helicobacter sp. 11S02596-1]
MSKIKKSHLLSAISVLLIILFICMDQPSLYGKLAQMNTQMPDIEKNFVVIFAYLVSFLCLLLASRAPTIIKYSLFVLIAVSTIVCDVFFLAGGKVLEYPDFIVLFQAKANAFDAIAMYAPFIFKSLGHIAILLVAFLIVPQKGKKIVGGGALACFIALFCITLGVCIIKKGGATNKLPTTASIYALFAAYQIDNFTNPHIYKYTTDAQPKYPSKTPHLVLIVDESVRYDFSPFERIRLDTTENNLWHIYDFKLATSGANCSATSNIILRKNAQPKHLKDDLYNNALIWSFANNAGYTTYLYDAQGLGKGHDYFDEKERELISHNISQHITNDTQILDALSYLDSPQKSFTYIIKKGSHFPYESNYPKGFEVPFSSPYIQKELPFRQNYINAVVYQSDNFFNELFKKKFQQPVMIIYTSDHGQNLKDTYGFTHCTTPDVKPYIGEGLVPLVVITNFKSKELQKAQTENLNKTSHFNIIPTFLKEMGFEASGSLYEPIREPLKGFFYRSVFGYFGSEPPYAEYIDPTLPDHIPTERFR